MTRPKTRAERNAAMRPENLAAVEALLDGIPAGITAEALARMIGKSVSVALNRLHGLREAGRAEWVTGHRARNYKAGRWALVKHRAVAVADAEKCAAAATTAAHEAKKARQRLREQGKRDAKRDADLAGFEAEVVQRVVAPSDWRCAVPRGVPNSVFALGAML